MDQRLLGVKIDYLRIDQALEIVSSWLQKKGKHYVVTPNPEMLIDASSDADFRKALNSADLAIPDSSRLGWGSYIKSEPNPFLKLIYSPFFLFPSLLGRSLSLFPHVLPRFDYPVTSGVDLMETLLSLSQEKGFTTAYLGGSKKVADKLVKCLRLKYPKLKIVFCSGNLVVNQDGDIQIDSQKYNLTKSKEINYKNVPEVTKVTKVTKVGNSFNHHLLAQKIDIMFVAFGHGKQEKWIHKNLPKLNTRVMMGVGGAFDYLSGEVPRAPEIIRQIGMEWLFRLINQPWRIKRFWKLFYFVWLVLK